MTTSIRFHAFEEIGLRLHTKFFYIIVDSFGKVKHANCSIRI